jgi:hypothetical protein
VGELDGGEEGLGLVLPGCVPFVEGVFGGGVGEEVDGRGLRGEAGFSGSEDGGDCRCEPGWKGTRVDSRCAVGVLCILERMD